MQRCRKAEEKKQARLEEREKAKIGECKCLWGTWEAEG
jgi:hypothetical protein